MRNMSYWKLVSILLVLPLAAGLVMRASAQDIAPVPPGTFFTHGNLVVSAEGCGVYGGTCTGIPNGTGNGTGNSSNTGYGDNQASLFTLFQYAPSGTASATYVNSLALPQTGSGANLPISAEYGSSSEASVQLDGTGRYLTLMGYGINANAFNANPTLYGVPGGELAQSGSLTGQSYTPIPRVVTTIDSYGNINSSTASFNVFNTNNPRSTYSADGVNFYISGQGTGCDLTGGVFLTTLGATNDAPTQITGGDAVPTASCVSSGYTGSLVAQDTRTVQIYGNTLYISMDSTEGKSDNRSLIGTLGTPPATSLFVPTAPPSGDTGGPNLLTGFGNTGGTGRVKLNAAESNGISPSGNYINVSPENYFFASPSVLYVADSGSPKNTSAANEAPAAYSLCGAGGLQKWVLESGSWTWVYTLYKGLNLVQNAGCSSNTAGTTGLLGLTGVVSGSNVLLYATNFTIGDLDPTYLYGITDTLSATTNPNNSFAQLAAAPSDSNFKGVSFAPSLPAGSATITSSPSGLTVSSSGTGCTPGIYTTPVTFIWTSGNPCQLSVVSPQTAAGTQYIFSQWQDGTTATTDSVTAPTASAVYTASFLIAQAIAFTPPTSPVTYGVAPIALSATGGASGIPVTFSLDAISTPGAASLSGPNNSTLTITGAGTVVVDANQGGNSTYAAATQMQQSITVYPATLTVTANNASMAVGAALPTFTATYSGFVNNDGVGVLSGAPSLTTSATSSSPAGLYTINTAQGTLSAANYTFAFVNGTLSIVQAPTVIITTSAVLFGSNSAGYAATITVKNTGTGAASNVSLNTATLGSTTGSTLPQSVASIPAGGSTVFSVSFPGSAGLDGAGVSEKYSGTYTGGSFSASVRSVTLP